MRVVSVTQTDSASYFFVPPCASTVFSLLPHVLSWDMTLCTYISSNRGCLGVGHDVDGAFSSAGCCLSVDTGDCVDIYIYIYRAPTRSLTLPLDTSYRRSWEHNQKHNRGHCG